MADGNETEPHGAAELPNDGPGQAQRPEPPTLDDGQALPSYANYCRVMGTPE